MAGAEYTKAAAGSARFPIAFSEGNEGDSPSGSCGQASAGLRGFPRGHDQSVGSKGTGRDSLGSQTMRSGREQHGECISGAFTQSSACTLAACNQRQPSDLCNAWSTRRWASSMAGRAAWSPEALYRDRFRAATRRRRGLQLTGLGLALRGLLGARSNYRRHPGLWSLSANCHAGHRRRTGLGELPLAVLSGARAASKAAPPITGFEALRPPGAGAACRVPSMISPICSLLT